MQWMRTEVTFPHRRAILVIRRGDLLNHFSIIRGLRSFRGSESDVNVIHDELLRIIEKDRPDLKGCTIDFMSYSLHQDGWEVLIGHPSLEPVEIGCIPKYIGLNKQEELLQPTIVT